MNKPGFTLVELLISTFIASLLGTLLFSALYQINKFVPVVDNTTAIYEKAALMNAQLERDLSGTTAPNEFYYRQPEQEKKKKQDEQKKQEAAKKEDADKKKSEASADAKAKADKEKKEKEEGEKKPKKPLEKIFYSTNKDGMINQLSFITTNPLQVYWSGKSGSPKPRIARILYTLKEDKGTPKSYSLVRKESPNLEFEPITKTGKEGPQENVLAEGIKSLAVEYTYYVPEAKEKPKEAAEAEAKTKAEASKEPKKKEIKKTTEWIPSEKKEGKEEPSQLPIAPQLIELKMALWDAQKKRSTPFTFKIRIRSDIPEKRETEDVTQKLLGTLREFFTQSFTPTPPTRITQGNQFNIPRGSIR